MDDLAVSVQQNRVGKLSFGIVLSGKRLVLKLQRFFELVLFEPWEIGSHEHEILTGKSTEYVGFEDLPFHLNAGSTPVGARKVQQDLLVLRSRDFTGLVKICKPIAVDQQRRDEQQPCCFHTIT